MIITLMLGFVAGWHHDFELKNATILNRMVMLYSLPLLLFASMVGMSRDQVLSQGPLAIAILAGMAGIYAVTFIISRYVLGSDPITASLRALAKTASAGSIYRIPAADIEDVVVSSLREHLVANRDKKVFNVVRLESRDDVAQLITSIVVHKDKLVVELKADHAEEESDCPDDRSLTIPWQKPPSKRSRQILLPHKTSRRDVRPEQFERRARLVSAIARSRQWLDDVVSGRVTSVTQLCTREKCSARQVNMTISLAFLAPNLVKAAVEGRLPRGIGIERLRDPPSEWSRQFEALGLNPE
jgi:hypothetical protein